MDLLKQDEKLLVVYTSGTLKAMTVLAEYVTRCLYKTSNFYSVLIVRPASS